MEPKLWALPGAILPRLPVRAARAQVIRREHGAQPIHACERKRLRELETEVCRLDHNLRAGEADGFDVECEFDG